MMEILDLSTVAVARSIRNKEISSTEVVGSYLKRIKEVNSRLNAVVQVDEETAYSRAMEADRALSQGRIFGPLHGTPFTVKDSFDTAGMISTGGTLGRSTYIPPTDASVVSRLRAAGGILLGKTNTSELTLTYETDNLIYGRTNNPYDLSRSPGGSSGGAAAIVSAMGTAFDIGSDYGGSLRYPAHCCGITTLKPTSGRVPRTGHILPFGGVLDSFQQIGPLTRCVEDLFLLLTIISGPDYIDPGVIPMDLKDPRDVDLKNLKVAFHTDNGVIPCSSDTEKVILEATAALRGEGLSITEARPLAVEKTYDLMIELLSADGGASIRRLLQAAGTKEHTLPWLGLAEPVAAVQFDSLMMKLSGFRSEMLSFFKDYDVILCPVNAFPAAPHGSLGADLEAFSYGMTYNITGWPAAVVRGGSSREGLPIGVQIIARPWREDIALAVAARLEKTLGGFQPPRI